MSLITPQNARVAGITPTRRDCLVLMIAVEIDKWVISMSDFGIANVFTESGRVSVSISDGRYFGTSILPMN